jgi:hypothetical protein
LLGGKDAADVVNKLLANTLSNKLAKLISLTGRGKIAQRGLKGTKFQELLYGKAIT